MANKFRQIVEAPSQFYQELKQLIPWLTKLWRTLGQVEEWIEVGGSGGEPPFEGTWANASGTDVSAAFFRDPFGIVHIKGLISSGTINTTAFTLPSGYRPNKLIELGTTANAAFGRLRINAVGTVVPTNGATTRFSIHCSFRAEQ